MWPRQFKPSLILERNKGRLSWHIAQILRSFQLLSWVVKAIVSPFCPAVGGFVIWPAICYPQVGDVMVVCLDWSD
ncbi:MAG: hypothetical protein CMJ20_07145 [Phycisphaeraceae bacterium]|nr:hypothetical protein [Phycisphaeraceae bacterium]